MYVVLISGLMLGDLGSVVRAMTCPGSSRPLAIPVVKVPQDDTPFVVPAAQKVTPASNIGCVRVPHWSGKDCSYPSCGCTSIAALAPVPTAQEIAAASMRDDDITQLLRCIKTRERYYGRSSGLNARDALSRICTALGLEMPR